MLHSCSFDSAKIRLFTENGGFFRLCFYQQKANTACLLFFCTNYHDCTTNFQQFIASAGAHRIIGGDSHRHGSHRFYRHGSRYFSSAGVHTGRGLHRRGFTPAGVHTGGGLHRFHRQGFTPPAYIAATPTGFPHADTKSHRDGISVSRRRQSLHRRRQSLHRRRQSLHRQHQCQTKSRSDVGYSAGVK